MAIHYSSCMGKEFEKSMNREQVACVLLFDRLLVTAFSGALCQIEPTVQRLDFGEERHQRVGDGFTHCPVAK